MQTIPIEAYLLVGLGGAIGGASRFIVSDGIALRWGTTFPWGTLVVNVTGALLIGMVVALARVHGGVFAGASTHDLVITGVLGGYTTARRSVFKPSISFWTTAPGLRRST